MLYIKKNPTQVAIYKCFWLDKLHAGFKLVSSRGKKKTSRFEFVDIFFLNTHRDISTASGVIATQRVEIARLLGRKNNFNELITGYRTVRHFRVKNSLAISLALTIQ